MLYCYNFEKDTKILEERYITCKEFRAIERPSSGEFLPKPFSAWSKLRRQFNNSMGGFFQFVFRLFSLGSVV